MGELDVAGLGPVAETLLIPLYGRALLTQRGSGLIDDPKAVEMVEAIDYDFAKFEGPSLLGSVLRTRLLDLWVQRWQRAHPGGTVVEIGAGLNTRTERLDDGAAHWVDVDLPDAMALRHRFFHESDRRRMVAASVLGDAWVTAAAASPGPWFVVVEAVLCFLPELEVRQALGHVAALAAAGPAGSEVAFDTWGTWMRDHQDYHDALRVMDTRVQWFCDSPTEIEAFGLGLRSTETVGLMDAPAELVDLLAPEDRAILDAARHDPQASSYRLHRFRHRSTGAGRNAMTTLGDIEFRKMDGSTGTLSDRAGDVILVVNVASKCGLTPHYEGLQQLYSDKCAEGFTILAFPANDFADEEPGTDAEIAEFCSIQYSVTFPVMSKTSVVGDDQHPLYAALAEQIPTADGKAEMRESLRGHGLTPTEDPDVLWNFEKFLIGRDGSVVGRFAPTVTPDDPTLLAAIEDALSR